jgi:hypothetical protein
MRFTFIGLGYGGYESNDRPEPVQGHAEEHPIPPQPGMVDLIRSQERMAKHIELGTLMSIVSIFDSALLIAWLAFIGVWLINLNPSAWIWGFLYTGVAIVLMAIIFAYHNNQRKKLINLRARTRIIKTKTFLFFIIQTGIL